MHRDQRQDSLLVTSKKQLKISLKVPRYFVDISPFKTESPLIQRPRPLRRMKPETAANAEYESSNLSARWLRLATPAHPIQPTPRIDVYTTLTIALTRNISFRSVR